MDDIKKFVLQAREKGLDDETIRQSLEAKGWDKTSVNLALADLDVPAPVMTKQTDQTAATTHKSSSSTPSLSPLLAALLHVILWFFTASSTVTIGGTVASLYGVNISTNALASMIAVTLVTFIPYAVLYSIFLRKNNKQAGVIPNKIWSIITICLHSIGAMIAAIVIVVTLITNGEQAILTSAILVMVLAVLVLLTYAFAAFGMNVKKTRTIFLAIHLPWLIVMFGVLFAMSLLNLGPAKHDEDLRRDLADVVRDIARNTRENNKLPNSIDTMTKNKTITYTKLSDTKYQVCATFQTSSSAYSSYYDSYNGYAEMDDYISDNQFNVSTKGDHCFEFTSSYLEGKRTIEPTEFEQ